MGLDFQPDEGYALRLDEHDVLGGFRRRFRMPLRGDGTESVYFAGNSLGLQPVDVGSAVQQELEDWARLGVDGHFEGRSPWFSYHEQFRGPVGRLVGARPDEVVMMNGLTVNLHLMMVSFYRPTAGRHKILIEDTAFPSDTYAVKSQLRYHGFDPDEALIVASSGSGHATLQTGEIEDLLERQGDEIALVMLSGVNYFTGQAFDIQRITGCAHAQGCLVGFDLAHAAGNLVLHLHDWGVDFAVWCTYKYLNAGPGAVAGCFVHQRHGSSHDLPRFSGWWGNDPETRFRMHLIPEFEARAGADGWQLSNPPVLALAPLRASLALFDEAGIEALRAKSRALTGYLAEWIDHASAGRVEVLTPADPEQRGCQISMRVRERPRELFEALKTAGVVGDFRPPDVVRVAPVPLYNSFHDVWQFGRVVADWSGR